MESSVGIYSLQTLAYPMMIIIKLDHKIRWIDSFDDSEENLRALCVSCHKQKTAMENQI